MLQDKHLFTSYYFALIMYSSEVEYFGFVSTLFKLFISDLVLEKMICNVCNNGLRKDISYFTSTVLILICYIIYGDSTTFIFIMSCSIIMMLCKTLYEYRGTTMGDVVRSPMFYKLLCVKSALSGTPNAKTMKMGKFHRVSLDATTQIMVSKDISIPPHKAIAERKDGELVDITCYYKNCYNFTPGDIGCNSITITTNDDTFVIGLREILTSDVFKRQSQ